MTVGLTNSSCEDVYDFPITRDLIDSSFDLPSSATQIVLDYLYTDSGVIFDHDLPFVRDRLESYVDRCLEVSDEDILEWYEHMGESAGVINIVVDYLSNCDNRVVFDRDLPFICEQIESFESMPSALAKTVIDYLRNHDNPFGREEWKAVGLDPGPVSEWSKELTDFWYGPDPIDPTLQVCETHIPPVYKPENVSLGILRDLGFPFILGRLAKVLNQLQDITSGPACWLVQRKGMLEKTRGRPLNSQIKVMEELNAKTGANYEVIPSIVDLACVIFARYSLKKERHLGDRSGAENQITRSRCIEKYKSEKPARMEIMGSVILFDCEPHTSIGSFSPNGVEVMPETNEIGLDPLGIVQIRKFKA